MDMDTIKLDSVYVPTLKDPLVVRRQKPTQALVRPCQTMLQRALRLAAEYKTTAVLVVNKIISFGKSILKYLKKDFLKKEGVPLKGVVVYKGAAKGVGKIISAVH